jgi:hypothetical protein
MLLEHCITFIFSYDFFSHLEQRKDLRGMKEEIIAIVAKLSCNRMNTHILMSFNQQAAYFPATDTFGVARVDSQPSNTNVMVGTDLRSRSFGV